jgi:hypothetical protein
MRPMVVAVADKLPDVPLCEERISTSNACNCGTYTIPIASLITQLTALGAPTIAITDSIKRLMTVLLQILYLKGQKRHNHTAKFRSRGQLYIDSCELVGKDFQRVQRPPYIQLPVQR